MITKLDQKAILFKQNIALLCISLKIELLNRKSVIIFTKEENLVENIKRIEIISRILVYFLA